MTEIPAMRKLEMMAEEFDWPLEDLSGWYQHDMADLERKKISEVRFIVRDYITNYAACRDEPGAELLTKWREIA